MYLIVFLFLVLSGLTLYYLYNGSLSIEIIKNLLKTYRRKILIVLSTLVFICLVIYLLIYTGYSITNESLDESNLPEANDKIIRGDNDRTLSTKKSSNQILDIVVTRLLELFIFVSGLAVLRLFYLIAKSVGVYVFSIRGLYCS